MKFVKNSAYGGVWVPDHCEDKGPIKWTADTWADGMIHKVVNAVPEDRRNIALDLGANVGMTAIGLSRYFETVHAVEADPLTFECLEKNTENFDNIHNHNYAVSIKDEDLKFSRVIGCSGHSHVFAGEHSNYEYITVKGKRLTEIIPENTKIDFLKIDIEGMEQFVIADNVELLARSECVVLVEVAHAAFKSFDGLYMTLRTCGYLYATQIPGKRDFLFVHKSLARYYLANRAPILKMTLT